MSMCKFYLYLFSENKDDLVKPQSEGLFDVLQRQENLFDKGLHCISYCESFTNEWNCFESMLCPGCATKWMTHKVSGAQCVLFFILFSF